MNSLILILIPVLLVVLGVFVGLCVLQVHLSKRASPVSGLILPIVTGGLALFIVLPILLFANYRTVGPLGVHTEYQRIEPDGAVVEDGIHFVPSITEEAYPQAASADKSSSMSILIFLIPLVFAPPVVYTVIYIVCRVSLRRKPPKQTDAPSGYANKDEMEKMNIQDL